VYLHSDKTDSMRYSTFCSSPVC